jgi:hypothetical protein
MCTYIYIYIYINYELIGVQIINGITANAY